MTGTGRISPTNRVSRSDGKASRQAILEATLIIILRDGIRAVKYKTVSEVAGVSPSATAYYFKDMQDLITEAFRYHLAFYKEAMAYSRGTGHRILCQYTPDEFSKREIREEIARKHTDALMLLIAPGDPDSATFMLLDRIFRNETLQNPKLMGALQEQDQKDIDALIEFYRQLNTEDPETDALHLMSILWYYGERFLHTGYLEQEVTKATDVVYKMSKKNLGIG
ncbi:TetR/AcrR family transcriptional regulator [Endozoicomonas arenosclerae]|uniref:TetR/AcrR family transcriptional regulator n=1 Tax=Endozoicomonas arenosclerae TaxID=1633495 RepID=UPI0007806ECA|nr:hypothetical protein [Endozoicomonas arenosclerae]